MSGLPAGAGTSLSRRDPRTPADAAAGAAYRYDRPRFYPDMLHDMFIGRHEAAPGDLVGDFVLLTTGGRRIDRRSFAESGRPMLVVFGSRTCPVTESAVEGLAQLHLKYGRRIRFVLVNVREAHPGARIPQPRTFDEKWRRAYDLKVHLQIPFEVASDDIDGALHRALGSRPNSAYLLDPAGRILLRVQWANATEALDDALMAILAGGAARTLRQTATAILRMVGYMSPVLRAAGQPAARDVWRIAPPLGVMMLVADRLAALPPSRRGGAAAALLAALVATVAGVALAFWL